MTDKIVLIGDKDDKLEELGYEVIAQYDDIDLLSNDINTNKTLMAWFSDLSVRHYQASLIVFNQPISLALIAVMMKDLAVNSYHGNTLLNFGLVIKDSLGKIERIDTV